MIYFPRSNFFLAPIYALFIILLFLSPARADEEISKFHSEIQIRNDGSLEVEETLDVNAQGQEILHGIRRFFPLSNKVDDSNVQTHGFELISASRDGVQEITRIEREPKYIQLYLGDPDELISHGHHIYKIKYITHNVIRHFSDHDELYWNTTGKAWGLYIANASVTVHLPYGATFLKSGVYTGPDRVYRDYSNNAINGKSTDKSIVAFSTHYINAGEDLTVVVSFPKGFVKHPNWSQSLRWYLEAHRPDVIAGGGLLCLIFTFCLVLSYTRPRPRPRPRPIDITQNSESRIVPPPNISPALALYLSNIKKWNTERDEFEIRALSGTLVHLAVKGIIKIDKHNGFVRISRTEKPLSECQIAPDEIKLLQIIEGNGNSLLLNREDVKLKSRVLFSYRFAVMDDYNLRFQIKQLLFMLPISIAGVMVQIIPEYMRFGNFSPPIVWSPAVICFIALVSCFISKIYGVYKRLYDLLDSFVWRIVVVRALIMLPVFIICAAVEPFDFILLVSYALIPILEVVLLFKTIMPSKYGEKVKAHVLMVVKLIEDVGKPSSPRLSSSAYETLLPYAVTFGEHERWKSLFSTHEGRKAYLERDTLTWMPFWFNLDVPDTNSIITTVTNLTNDLSKAVSEISDFYKADLTDALNSLDLPGSSSGFSDSGFGGDGGGGGGGW